MLQFAAILPAHLPTQTFHHPANPHYPILLLLTRSRPPVTTTLKFSNRAISLTAPRIWNDLPPELRAFPVRSPSLKITHHHPLASLSVTHKVFHSKLKCNRFKYSYPHSSHPLLFQSP